MDAFDFYRVYKPVHLHFSQDKFDMMSKKCRCTEKEFESRNDRMIITKIANNIGNRKDAAKICVSNFSLKEYWLTDSDKEITRRLKIWREYRKFPAESFDRDLKALYESTNGKAISQLIVKTPSGNVPPILQLWSKDQLSSDFVCMLDKATPFIDTCDEFWFRESGAKLRLTKNRSFIKIDEEQVKSILSSVYKE